MPLEACTLNLDRTKRELHPHGTPDFPCAGYQTVYSEQTYTELPWHWHDEMEAIYIARGNMDVQVPDKNFNLHEGDGIFINSGVLHHAHAAPFCELHSLVFNPILITGSEDSAISRRYIRPLVQCSLFDGFPCGQTAEGKEITGYIAAAFDALKEGRAGYEFAVRENLSRMCFTLYTVFHDVIDSQSAIVNQDSVRIQKMMTFIHQHFTEKLKLQQIASVADVGERECMRCFQRVIQISPLQYLIKYRLWQAAILLLKDGSMGIADIALNCGFDSPSNFTQQFRHNYSCTPHEYRNRHTQTVIYGTADNQETL